jgi:hypothetical protein
MNDRVVLFVLRGSRPACDPKVPRQRAPPTIALTTGLPGPGHYGGALGTYRFTDGMIWCEYKLYLQVHV